MTAPCTIFFDLGGVLSVDPWETLLLTPDRGLADRLNVPSSTMRGAGQYLWTEFSLTEANEQDYWSALEGLIGQRIDRSIIGTLEQDLWVLNPLAEELLATASIQSRTGILSDNTEFWFRKQESRLNLDKYVDSELVFISCRSGVSKADGGLFELARRSTEPSSSLFIDDRLHNLEKAKDLGFQTFLLNGFSGSMVLLECLQEGLH